MIKQFTIVLLIVFGTKIFASTDTLFLSAKEFESGKVYIADYEDIETWRYHSGDDSSWASPSFDDSLWEKINPMMWMNVFNIDEWQGIGWFRKVIQIDTSLVNKPIGIIIHHEGASELFLDGKKIFSFGKVGNSFTEEEIYDPSYAPYVFKFDSNKIHTIAVRYSNHTYQGWEYLYQKFFSHIGFSIALIDFNENIENEISFLKESSAFISGMFAFTFAFSLIFFLLYFFYSKRIENLFFASFVFGISLFTFSAGIQQIGHVALEIIAICRLIQFLGISIIFISLLLFLYHVVYKRMIKLFWYFLAGFIMINLVSFVRDDDGSGFDFLIPLVIVVCILLIESGRVIMIGVIRKIKNIKILAVGTILFVLLFISGMVVPSFFMEMGQEDSTLMLILSILTFTCLPTSMAIYLAKSYSETQYDLEKQIIHVKELSAKQIEQAKTNAELHIQSELERKEYERRTQELDEARKLQLSLLPKQIPKIEHLDIAVYMNTATEVGGDYYDFLSGDSKTLTALVGDATGHGMKAGTMVTITKSLFQNLCNTPELDKMFQQFNGSIISMGLQPMLMSLMLMRINVDKLEIINGGMPEVWIHKNKSKQILEIEANGPPLGAFGDYEYKSNLLPIEKGDAILLMSDGFIERFNENNQMMGYDRCKKIFLEIAHLTSQEIVEGLKKESVEWGGSRAQDDDITFVIIKIK